MFWPFFVLIIGLIGIAILAIKIPDEEVSNSNNDWLNNAQRREHHKYEYTDAGKTTRNLRYDEKKGNWIDIDREAQMERHRQYKESTAGSRDPTFEEWKATREGKSDS